MKPLVETAVYDGKGYESLIEFESWCVALINDGEEFHRENITFLERHDATDEVFVLLSGACVLYIGDGDDTLGNITAVRLEMGKLYNVKKSVWHNLVVRPGTQVLIVENADTGRSNSRYLPVSQAALPEEIA